MSIVLEAPKAVLYLKDYSENIRGGGGAKGHNPPPLLVKNSHIKIIVDRTVRLIFADSQS